METDSNEKALVKKLPEFQISSRGYLYQLKTSFVFIIP